MKKMICVVMALMLLLAAGCASKTSAPVSGSEDVSTETAQSPDTEIAEAVSEADFTVNSLGDATCEISGCSYEGKDLVIPEKIDGETVVGIAGNAFFNLPAERIVIPDTVTYLGDGAIQCEKVAEIQLGSGLKEVGYLSFNNCYALKSLTLPEGMEAINGALCSGCLELEEVYIPASVTTFGDLITTTELCPKIVIVTPAGSAAEAAAQEAGLPIKNA